MNFRNRLKALESKSVPKTLPEGEGKRQLEQYLDQLAERLGPPSDEQADCAEEFLRNDWPAFIAEMRQNNGSAT